MRIELILVPYDSGQRGVRMGRGPLHLIESGFDRALRALGHDVRVTHVESSSDFPLETAVAFELAAKLAERVRAAVAAGAFPLVLAGNCMSAVGTCAGLGADSSGVVWLDAHGDLHTPETTESGFLDGMALATLMGRCWSTLIGSIGGVPVPEQHVILLGGSQLDAAESRLLSSSALRHVPPTAVRHDAAVFDDACAGLAGRRVYVHVDLDVLDAAVARANAYASDGGLTLDEVTAAISRLAHHARIGAAAITAYDPSFDEGDRVRHAAVRVVRTILTAAHTGGGA